MPSLPALLLHSGFRTGSTWFWNCFRQAGGYGYYEPFHGRLAGLKVADIDAMFPGPAATAQAALEQAKLGHPSLVASPFEEFRPLLREAGGAIHYHPRFAYEMYFDTDENPAQARYVNFLIDYARGVGRVPVLGFCRSLSRVAWFRTLGDGVNIVTWRNPWDQWVSYHNQLLRYGNGYFEFRSYHLAAIGSQHPDRAPYFADLAVPPARELGLHPAAAREGLALLRDFKAADPARRFRIFLRLFLVDMLHALPNADLVVDLDRMTADLDYRQQTTDTLRGLSGLERLDFADCRLTRHAALEDAPYALLMDEGMRFLEGQPASTARDFLRQSLDATANRLRPRAAA